MSETAPPPARTLSAVVDDYKPRSTPRAGLSNVFMRGASSSPRRTGNVSFVRL
jgi:hypothetical protein